MKITLLGTGTSYPDPERVQSGILVEQDRKLMLLDVGSGVLHRLVQTGADVKSIDSVFISHLHVDHCSDFMSLYQTLMMSGFDKNLHLFGPPTVNEWFAALNDRIYPYLKGRVPVEVTSLKELDTVQVGALTVRCCRSKHGTVDSRAVRVEHKDHSFVYSSDTAPSKDVMELTRGTDLLIHECMWLDGKHPEGVHTAPSELVRIMEEARPKKVILTHLSPEVVSSESRVASTIGQNSGIDVAMGIDLMSLKI